MASGFEAVRTLGLLKLTPLGIWVWNFVASRPVGFSGFGIVMFKGCRVLEF